MRPDFQDAGTLAPENLIAGDYPLVTESVILKSGENRARGALLGEVLAIAAAAADAGNTGDGAFGAITGGKKLKVGTYTVLCIAAAANAGTFILIDPDGNRIGKDITVAVAYTSDHLNFTIADGAADFVVGDKFTVAVTRTGKFIHSAAAAVDGSNVPSAILAEAVDASAADERVTVYRTGEFNQRAVVFGAGHTAASTKDELRKLGIILRGSVAKGS